MPLTCTEIRVARARPPPARASSTGWTPAATPEHPSADPRYVNPSNEVWLEVQTDAAGHGRSQAVVPFGFTVDHYPRSLVIHEATDAAAVTDPAVGSVGLARGRACVTISIGGR